VLTISSLRGVTFTALDSASKRDETVLGVIADLSLKEKAHTPSSPLPNARAVTQRGLFEL
jgi:hypothetical protein